MRSSFTLLPCVWLVVLSVCEPAVLGWVLLCAAASVDAAREHKKKIAIEDQSLRSEAQIRKRKLQLFSDGLATGDVTYGCVDIGVVVAAAAVTVVTVAIVFAEEKRVDINTASSFEMFDTLTALRRFLGGFSWRRDRRGVCLCLGRSCRRCRCCSRGQKSTNKRVANTLVVSKRRPGPMNIFEGRC